PPTVSSSQPNQDGCSQACSMACSPACTRPDNRDVTAAAQSSTLLSRPSSTNAKSRNIRGPAFNRLRPRLCGGAPCAEQPAIYIDIVGGHGEPSHGFSNIKSKDLLTTRSVMGCRRPLAALLRRKR